MLLPAAALAGAAAQGNLNSRMNDMTDELSDSESKELLDYMSDEENANKNGSDEENMEDSNLANAVNMQKQHWLNPPTKEIS